MSAGATAEFLPPSAAARGAERQAQVLAELAATRAALKSAVHDSGALARHHEQVETVRGRLGELMDWIENSEAPQ